MLRRLFIPLFCFLMLAGCAKNEVKLSFSLPQDANTPCRILYYASAKNVGMVRETVAEITAGKGEIVLPTHYPTLICLFSPSQKLPAAYIYAERGDKFEITGSNESVMEWNIKGNKPTEELSEWRLKHLDLLRGFPSDEEKLRKAVAEFVERHPGSAAAVVILLAYFPRRGNEREFYALRDKIDKKVLRDDRLMEALSSGDLFTQLPDTYSLPAQLVLHGDSGYADTLRFRKGEGALLIFRSSSSSDLPADSLKALLKRVKGRKTVEIFMESDSLNWRRYLRRDSIEGASRLWMPLGLADTMAIRMGVKRLPYFIVVDPDGKDIYRGDDWKEAVKKFENH